MKDNRWGLYKVKSKDTDSTKPTAEPSTIGKADLEGVGVGQDRGSGVKGGLKASSEPKGYDTRLELLNQIVAGWVRELKFHPVRRWRFDYAHKSMMIAVEVEGGVWTRNSRHTRGAGYLADCEKYNQAQIMGYRVLRYSPKQMTEMIEDVQLLLRTQGLSG